MSNRELTAEQIKANTEVVDITDDPAWMAAARWEIAAGYSKLVNPKQKVRIREIYAALCEDGYERDGRSRTLAAITTNPHDGSKEIAALVRIVLGRKANHPHEPLPIDAMNFFEPELDWPHRLRNMRDDEIGEMGRFVIADKYRTSELKASKTDVFLGGRLIAESYKVAKARGIRLLYAIMPAIVSELFVRNACSIEEVRCKPTNRDAAREVFERFSVYWGRMAPKLYQLRPRCVAVTEFASQLPKHGIITDSKSIERSYVRNVTALHRDVPLVLQPANDQEVSEIVRLANFHHVPLYPFSTGKNWGLGSKLPVTDDCVIVDLSRMNRIIEVNEEFGYAILEPGVTQLQLAKFLNAHHPSLTINFTGSFAYTGIVGNVLERGDGAHARVEDLLGVKGILGNGKPFACGGFWPEAGSGWPGHVSRYVAGADLCGMFCQSNFGIVTQMAFRLIRKPECRYVIWGSAADERLEELVETIGRFAEQGVINRGSVNIGYANRFVQAQRTMVERMGETPMPRGEEKPEWNFYVLVGGTRRVADVLAEEIGEALKPVCTSSGAFRVGREAGDHDSPDALPIFLQPLVAPLLGLPDTTSIKLIYQLTGTALPENEAEIDADQTPFGMKCYIPVVPPKGKFVRQAAEIVSEVQRKAGMNVKVSFFGDGRTLITIHFRTDDAEQVRRAEACEKELWERMMAAHFWPYRVSIDQMQRLVESRPEFFELVGQLKAALDPNGIIAPGRYCPVSSQR